MLIAFIPEKEVIGNMRQVRKITGIKPKRNSAPHITIVDNTYSDINKVDKELKEISKEFSPFDAKIKGFDTFVVNKKLRIEKYQQKNSLIYLIKKNPLMNKFRKELFLKLDYLKTKERFGQWKKENPNLSKKALANIEKYGTPFGLNEWRFHVTMGLIPKDKTKEILEKIRGLNLNKTWKISHFGLFVRKNGWVLFRKYRFGSVRA